MFIVSLTHTASHAHDPLHQAGVARHDISEFVPALAAGALAGLRET